MLPNSTGAHVWRMVPPTPTQCSFASRWPKRSNAKQIDTSQEFAIHPKKLQNTHGDEMRCIAHRIASIGCLLTGSWRLGGSGRDTRTSTNQFRSVIKSCPLRVLSIPRNENGFAFKRCSDIVCRPRSQMNRVSLNVHFITCWKLGIDFLSFFRNWTAHW